MTTTGTKDAAGMTRDEVEQLTPEQRFDLVGERYLHMQELMTGAQEHISTEPWTWLTGGPGIPVAGPTAWDPLPGATNQNAYFLEMARSTRPEGATGSRADAEPMTTYFESQGWQTQLTGANDGPPFIASATTDDGYHLQYTVQENGQYNIDVMSNMFWGNQNELSSEVSYRIDEDAFFPLGEASVPGVYIPFPKWSDPLLWGPDVQGE